MFDKKHKFRLWNSLGFLKFLEVREGLESSGSLGGKIHQVPSMCDFMVPSYDKTTYYKRFISMCFDFLSNAVFLILASLCLSVSLSVCLSVCLSVLFLAGRMARWRDGRLKIRILHVKILPGTMSWGYVAGFEVVTSRFKFSSLFFEIEHKPDCE